MDVIEHLEEHLGPIEAGWSRSNSGEAVPFQVVRLAGKGLQGVTAFATLGLSKTPLPSRRSPKLIRHELLFLVSAEHAGLGVAGLLQRVGLELLQRNGACLRGDVIGPRGSLFPGSEMEALYVALPVYLPDSFAVRATDAGEQVVFPWLVPIAAGESEYVADHGWPAFEDRLMETDPDLCNPFRPALRLCPSGGH